MNYTKPKGIFSNIYLMLAILAIVIVLMFIIKRKKITLQSFNQQFTEIQEPADVIDHRYYNKPFRFSIAAPDSTWKFYFSPAINSTFISGSEENNPKTVVQFSRLDGADTSVVVKIGIFKNQEQTSLEEIANRNLIAVSKQYQTNREPVTILSPVTVAGSINLTSAFHVVELPANTTNRYQVLVTMFVLRQQLAYKILCQAKLEQYEKYRTPLENILKSFSFQ